VAARGYWQAYQAVHKSLGRVLHGENSGLVADEQHRTWYRELFAPSVTTGLLKPADLAGYRLVLCHPRFCIQAVTTPSVILARLSISDPEKARRRLALIR